MNNGLNVVGTFLQLKSEPWKKDPSRFNHRMVITNEYQDQDGCPQTDKYLIEVLDQDLPLIQQQAPRIQGKQVIVPVVANARQFGTGSPFISMFMPKGARILMAPTGQQEERKAS